eukprot:scaffold1061_cov213-Prasinococcus_capsulatus_cf.AAC.10
MKERVYLGAGLVREPDLIDRDQPLRPCKVSWLDRLQDPSARTKLGLSTHLVRSTAGAAGFGASRCGTFKALSAQQQRGEDHQNSALLGEQQVATHPTVAAHSLHSGVSRGNDRVVEALAYPSPYEGVSYTQYSPQSYNAP